MPLLSVPYVAPYLPDPEAHTSSTHVGAEDGYQFVLAEPKTAHSRRTIRFHDLRHTCATLLLADDVNIKVVSEMLGHADISITLRIYAHVLPGMHEIAAQAMDDILSGD